MKSKDPINQTKSLVSTKLEKKQIKSEEGSVVENHSKRRLLINIALTTPVVMAVSSKPSLAQSVNAGDSIQMSGNLSNAITPTLLNQTDSECSSDDAYECEWQRNEGNN